MDGKEVCSEIALGAGSRLERRNAPQVAGIMFDERRNDVDLLALRERRRRFQQVGKRDFPDVLDWQIEEVELRHRPTSFSAGEFVQNLEDRTMIAKHGSVG